MISFLRNRNQFAFLAFAAILFASVTAFADNQTYSLTTRIKPTEAVFDGKTYLELDSTDKLVVTATNAQLYFTGVSSAELYCNIDISGNYGTEKNGKFRMQMAANAPVNLNGTVNLIGDSYIGSHDWKANQGVLTFNSLITGDGGLIVAPGYLTQVHLNNTSSVNNYKGNTQIGSSGMYNNSSVTTYPGTLVLDADEQIPDVITAGSASTGNLVLNSWSDSSSRLTSTLNLNGHTETVNGLVSSDSLSVITGTSGSKLRVGANNDTSTYSGNLQGAMQLEKIGTGTLTLTGTNSYTGDTTVSGGKLELQKSFSGSKINLKNGGEFALGGGSSAYTIWLSSSLNVDFDSYGGATFNTGARSSGNASNLVNNSATTFTTNGGATNYIVGTNGFNLHNAELYFNVAKGSDPSGIDLVVSTYLWNTRGHGIVKNGEGVMKITGDASYLNAYNGGTTINAGTLILGENGSLGSGNVTVAEGSTLEIQTQQGSTQTWNGGTISGAGTLNVSGSGAFTITPAQMQIADNGKLVVDGANVTLNNNAEANGNYSGAEIFINNGGSVTFSRSGSKDQFWLSKQTTITFDSNGGGTFNAGGNNSINLVNNAQNKFVTKGGATNYIVGDSGFNLHSQNLTFDVAKGTDPDGKDLVVSAKLWNGKGVVKEGAGTMVVTNGNNGYAGGTSINNGTLRLAENGVLGSGGVAIGANGALEFAYEADKTFGNAISGSGKIVKNGDNKVSLSGANTFTGDVNIQDGTLSTLINGTNKNLNITKLSGFGNLELRMASGSSDAKLPNLVNDNFTGVISLVQEGSASNTKINTGGNTFEGFTFKLNPGTTIFVTNELKADVLLAGGNGNSENRGSMRIANPVSGNLTLLDNSNIAFDSLQTVSGNISSGAASGQAVTLFINGKTDGTTLTNSRSNGAYTGDVSDGSTGSSLGITVCSQTQTFSGNLSYTGATTINSGAAITLTGDGANLAASRAAVVNGTLNFNNYSGEADMQLNNLSGSGAINGTDKNLVLNNTDNTTYTGTINIGTGTLTKDGEGKLTIQGAAGRLTASAYTINDGVLSIESANLIGSTPSVNVAQSGTLSLKFDSGSATRFNATNLSGSGVLELALYNGTGNTYLDNLNTQNFTGIVSLVQGGNRNGNKLNTGGLPYEDVTFIVNPDTTLFVAGPFKGDVILYGMGNSENRGAVRLGNTVSGDITVMTNTLIGCDWGANTTYHVEGDVFSGAETGEVTVQLKTTGDTAIMEFSGSISDGEAGAALGFQVLNCNTPHVFSGDLSYTGATTLNANSGLKLTGAGANLANSRAVAVNGTLDFAGYTGEDAMQFNNLTGTNGTITGGNNDLILNIAEDSFYSGKINIGTGTLTKKGEGNLKLLHSTLTKVGWTSKNTLQEILALNPLEFSRRATPLELCEPTAISLLTAERC
ncbi:MAG: autotransporter-associated beta strand repeat-containing protein [Thermoguttaceae bacterium]|nr:autotransporter-associated beta strand repeat-containing protein [Thermoguttaceae bacterium]